MKPNPYTIWPLNLATAGSVTIRGPWAQIAFLEALNASAQVTARITVRAGVESEDAVPMRPGTTFRNFETHSFYVEWEAQAGVTATLGLTNRPEQVDWNVPPVQPPMTLTGTVTVEETVPSSITESEHSIGTTVTHTPGAAAVGCLVFVSKLEAAGTVTVREGATGTRIAELEPGDSIWLPGTTVFRVVNASGTATVFISEFRR